jgi:hypothetical protein
VCWDRSRRSGTHERVVRPFPIRRRLQLAGIGVAGDAKGTDAALAGRIRRECRHNRIADDGDVQQVDVQHLLDGKITSRRRMPLEERADVVIQRVPACLATCRAQGILIRSRRLAATRWSP